MNTQHTHRNIALISLMALLVTACGGLDVGGLASAVGTQPESAVTVPTTTYVVKQGDTPKGVALMFCTDVETLIALNAEAYPGMAQTPMKFNYDWLIRVPANCASSTAANNTAPSTSATSASVAVDPGSPVSVPASSWVTAGNDVLDEAAAQEIIRLTNEARIAAGVAPLTVDEGLMAIARQRAVEISTDWGHQDMLNDCPECGENIASGGAIAVERHFNGWMNSPSHHRNLLGESYSSIGAAYYLHDHTVYAVQVFH